MLPHGNLPLPIYLYSKKIHNPHPHTLILRTVLGPFSVSCSEQALTMLSQSQARLLNNLPCDWPSTAWACSKQETENGPRSLGPMTSHCRHTVTALSHHCRRRHRRFYHLSSWWWQWRWLMILTEMLITNIIKMSSGNDIDYGNKTKISV